MSRSFADCPADIRATAAGLVANFGFEPALLEGAIAAALDSERERCANRIEGGFDRKVGVPFRDDGVTSKNDKCEHGRVMYEDCEACAAAAIRGEG